MMGWRNCSCHSFCVLVTFLGALACGVARAESFGGGEEEFLNAHRAEVIDCLQQIHHHVMTEEDRFLILASASQHYVQCMYHDEDTRIYCEASNGSYGPDGRLPLAAHDVAAIERLGFEDRPVKNFSLDMVFNGEADYTRIADLMLHTMHILYKPGTGHIELTAPFCGHRIIVS